MSKQITTLTFFKYPKLKDKIWAFWMMQFAHSALRRQSGLQSYKLLGSGKEGFSPWPDWSVYGLLQVWDSHKEAQEFFDSSSLYKRYVNHSEQQLTFYMKNIKAYGQWSKKNPFEQHSDIDTNNPYLTVITRATIKPHMLKKFWDYVPISQKGLKENPSLLFTAGVGERPFTHMATFSLWDDARALKKFAYRGNNHKKAIQQTQALQWYKEEMFSRFQPYLITGSWQGFTIPELLSFKGT
ncbi:DUF3291 domain-containing protein [Nonlabens tegetincola]|uniref:DUF3291 domain-containing protein n=1 Tax=Nonlabens tegetincola TaxID=323273 RepID=UPI0030C8CA2F